MEGDFERSFGLGEALFGEIGTECAEIAGQLATLLSVSNVIRPSDADAERPNADALELTLTLAHLAPLIAVPEDVDGDVRRTASDNFAALYAALPFDEAERRWLVDMAGLAGADALRLTEFVRAREGVIMRSGQTHPVAGHELIRHWSQWCARAPAFEEAGSVDLAVAALRDIEALMK